MTFIGNVLKAIAALAMILGVILVGAFIFSSTNLHFNFGGSSNGSGSSSTASTGNSSGQTVAFTVKPGDTATTIADNLQAAGIIDSTFWFKLRVRLKGADNFKAGTFQLSPGMDTDKLIDTLNTAPLQVGVRFTVIEGTRIEEIAETLAAKGLVDKDKFIQLAGTPEGAAQYKDDFLKTSGKPDNQGLEGYLFPDTYEIKQAPGDNSDVIIRKMLSTMESKFTPDMIKTMQSRGVNIHQVLTVASIVQREGKLKEELPVISSVFWNRVNQGMQLGADPTTQYALGKTGAWWPQLNLDPHTVNSPYNTYNIVGLPPGPIANPGLDAIQAAVSPAQDDYLYFVAKNDGSGGHAFAKTLEEHERNRVIYGNK